MRTLLVMVVVAAALNGCAARQKLYEARPVHIETPADGTSRCVERLLARSRVTGYIEQTVDKEMGFFRVMAKNVRPEREAKKRAPRVPKDKLLAVVEFYNVQCTGETSAVVTAMNSRGALDSRYVMDVWQRDELNSYASDIGLPSPTGE